MYSGIQTHLAPSNRPAHLALLCRAEFARCGLQFPAPGTKVIDLMRIFHKHERRDLPGAVEHFLNRAHDEEAGALSSAKASLEVLDEMVSSSSLG